MTAAYELDDEMEGEWRDDDDDDVEVDEIDEMEVDDGSDDDVEDDEIDDDDDDDDVEVPVLHRPVYAIGEPVDNVPGSDRPGRGPGRTSPYRTLLAEVAANHPDQWVPIATFATRIGAATAARSLRRRAATGEFGDGEWLFHDRKDDQTSELYAKVHAEDTDAGDEDADDERDHDTDHDEDGF